MKIGDKVYEIIIEKENKPKIIEFIIQDIDEAGYCKVYMSWIHFSELFFTPQEVIAVKRRCLLSELKSIAEQLDGLENL